MTAPGNSRPQKGFFVTATDTGVGKTVFTAALALRLRAAGRDVVALKPFASGAIDANGRRVSADARFLEQAACSGETLDDLNPVLFDAPLAPAVAARLEGRSIDVQAVASHVLRVAARHEIALVEGIGGLLVPLTDACLVADFAAMLGLPLIVAARPGLGTINHTTLTVECARARGLRVAGIVICALPATPDIARETNPAEIQRITRLPVLATLPAIAGIDVEAGLDTGLQPLAAAIDPLLFI